MSEDPLTLPLNIVLELPYLDRFTLKRVCKCFNRIFKSVQLKKFNLIINKTPLMIDCFL
jgi:hypothetical protein